MSLFRELKTLPRIAWILCLGGLLNRMGTFVLLFLALYLKDQGYSASQAGFTLGAYGVGAVIASGVGGHLADVFGRRNTIVLSMVSSAVVILALSQADSLPMFIALAVVTGASSELYRPAAAALLADVTAPEQRVTAYAAYRLAINLGMAVGPAMGGFLYEHAVMLIFVADAVTSIAFAVVAVVALPNRTVAHEVTHDRGSAVSAILRDRYFVIFLLASTLAAFVYMQAHTNYPLQIDAYGLSAKIYGMLVAANASLILLVELPITEITRRRNSQAVMFVGFLLVGGGFAMTGFVSSFSLLLVSVVIWTFGEMVMVPVAAAQVANIAPAHMRGRYQGAFTMTWGIGGVLAPVAGPLLFAQSPQLLWVVCGALCLVAGILVGVTRPRPLPHDDTPSAPLPTQPPAVPGDGECG